MWGFCRRAVMRTCCDSCLFARKLKTLLLLGIVAQLCFSRQLSLVIVKTGIELLGLERLFAAGVHHPVSWFHNMRVWFCVVISVSELAGCVARASQGRQSGTAHPHGSTARPCLYRALSPAIRRRRCPVQLPPNFALSHGRVTFGRPRWVPVADWGRLM